MLSSSSGGFNLFRRVVERRSLVDDVNSQIFERRVADDLQSRMRYIAVIDCGSPGRQGDLLPICRFKWSSLKHIECPLAMMNVASECFARLSFDHRDDHL